MAESTSIYFPGQALADSFVMWPQENSYSRAPGYSTEIAESIGGFEQRRQLYPASGIFRCSFRTMALTAAQHQQVRDFIRTVQGQKSPFYFFDFDPEYYSQEVVSPAAGHPGGANLAIAYKIALSGDVTQVRDDTASITYTVNTVFGTGGEARLETLQGPPGGGSVIDATFTGRKRYVCRFANDAPPRLILGGGSAQSYKQYDFSLREAI